MIVRGNNFYDAWIELLRAVHCTGHTVRPRGIEVKELLHTQLVVNDLQNNILYHPHRDLNYRFMVAEWLWIQAGRQDVKSIARYNKNIANFSDDGVIFNGAYGPRLALQWDWIIENLKKDPDSRQAVMTIFSPTPGPTKDIPCTLSLQVFIRSGRLDGIMTMRSNDLWLGLPHDFFNFSQIVNGLAGSLGVLPGTMTLQAGSSHIYQTNKEAVEKVLAEPTIGYHVRSPQLPCLLHADRILDWAEGKDNEGELLPSDYSYIEALTSGNKAKALKVLKNLA